MDTPSKSSAPSPPPRRKSPSNQPMRTAATMTNTIELDDVTNLVSVLESTVLKTLRIEIPAIIEQHIEKHLERSTFDSTHAITNSACLEESLTSLKDSINEIKTEVTSFGQIKNEIHEIKESQHFMSKKFDELCSSQSELKKLAIKTKKRVADLENLVQELEEKIDILTERQQDHERRSRLDNLEFHNIPFSTGENCENLITDLCKKIDVPIQSFDISNCHRLSKNNKKKPSPIIAKFINRKTRDRIIKNRSKIKSLDISTVFQKISRSTKVFVIENLSDTNKDLFFKARDLKRACGYKFLWTNNGRVLIKKNLDTATIPIITEDDLLLIK
ncbi:uncharacterized protein LOC144420015 [Styela clava]